MANKYVSSDQVPEWSSIVDENGKEYVIYSNTGEKYTPEQFRRAASDYVAGKSLDNFTVLEKGVATQLLRGAFESGRGVLEGSLERADTRLNEQLNAVPRAMFGKDLFNIRPNSYLGEQINTPEKALSALGTTAATAATGGLTGALPLLLRAGGAGLGHLVGQAATGNMGDRGRDKAQALMTFGVTALTEGATGVLKRFTGTHLSDKAKQLFTEEISDLVSKRYGTLSRSGVDGIEAIMSTKEGIRQFTQAGIDALKNDMDDIAKGFLPDINAVMPRTIGKVKARHIQEQLDTMSKETSRYLNNLDDKKIYADARVKVKEAEQEIIKLVSEEFAGKSGNLPADVITNLRNVFGKYSNVANNLRDGAEVLSLLRESGQQFGFDRKAFQQAVVDRLKSNPDYLNRSSDLLKGVAQAGFGNAPVGSAVDRNRYLGIGNIFPDNVSGIRIPGFVKSLMRVRAGKEYVGLGRDFTNVPIDAAAVNEFFKQKREKVNYDR